LGLLDPIAALSRCLDGFGRHDLWETIALSISSSLLVLEIAPLLKEPTSGVLLKVLHDLGAKAKR
jgi:hypothetical protein